MRNVLLTLLTVISLSIMGAPCIILAEDGKPSYDHSPKRVNKELWCKEHDMPEKECVICHPELRDKGRLWCNEHGRYEDRCWLCHPELEDTDRPYCETHYLYLKECKHWHDQQLEKHNHVYKHPSEDSQLWCKKHDMPEKECVICHPELRDKGRLWCNEHGRYEDRCWLCHPELQDTNRTYCEKHFLYLDECQHIHPEHVKMSVNQKKHSQLVSENNSLELYCKEHDLLEIECGLCHPELLKEQREGHRLKIRLPSKDSPELTGITTSMPKKAMAEKSIQALGEIKFDQNRTAHLVAPVTGVIKKVYVDMGDRVQEHQKLLSLWSPAIGEAVSEAILAEQTLHRIQRLRNRNISSAGELDKAEAEHRTALQKLRSLGFSDTQLQRLGDNSNDPIVLTITAPFTGEVVARDAVYGEYVETGHPIFTISDRSEMWAILNLSEKYLSSILVGQKVSIVSQAFPNETFPGVLTHISASIDPRTRMAVLRVLVKNSAGKLRENMFIEASIEEEANQHALLVPFESIQNIDGVTVAFTEVDSGLYEVRPVTIGNRVGDFTQVLTGLEESHRVVNEGSQVVKSHFLISRLGAGCVH